MKKWIDRQTLGGAGPENGTILKDQEFDKKCRVILETKDDYRAITCLIYGGMDFSVYCSIDKADHTFEAIKSELSKFMAINHDDDNVIRFSEYLFHKYYLNEDVTYWE